MWTNIPTLPDNAPSRGLGHWLPRILVPLAVVAWLFFAGHARVAWVVLAIATTLVITTLASPRADRAITGALATFGRWVGTGLGVALLGVIFGVVFAGVSLFFRLTGRDPLRMRPNRALSSYWDRVAPDSNARTVARPFALESRLGEGMGRAPGAVLVLALNAFGGLLLHAAGWSRPHVPDPRAGAVAYDGAEWVQAYFSELRRSDAKRYAGFVGWRRKDFAGEYINVTDGIRRSDANADGGDEVLEVYFFGGSTMWGVGNRDGATIPSVFARAAAADGVPVRVTNFGESGYVAWQEVALFAELCASGRAPDVAIFYDGANEAFVQLQRASSAPAPMNYDQLRDRFESRGLLARYSAFHVLLGHVLARVRPPGETLVDAAGLDPPVDARAAGARTLYRASVRQAEAIAASYGVRALFFWQPHVHTKKHLYPGEEPMRDAFGSALPAIARAASEGLAPPVIDITDAFDGVDGPVMIDWCHTSERGAAAVAGAIYAHARPALEAARAGRTAGAPKRPDALGAGGREGNGAALTTPATPGADG